MSKNEQILLKTKKGEKKVCCYGLGYLGKRLYKEIPGIFGLEPDLYCDKNDERVKSTVIENLTPIYLEDLLSIQEEIIVFVLVDDPYDLEIMSNLEKNPNLYVFSLRDLLDMDAVLEYYYGIDLYEKIHSLPIKKGF